MKVNAVFVLTVLVLVGCATIDPMSGPPPKPGTLRSQREAREPISEILAVSQDEISQYLQVSSPVWEDQVIYFILTDRFDDGNPNNSDQGVGSYDPRQNRYYSGGDLQGILDNLDYIKGLGATAIWITPPVANQWWDPVVQYSGYHGYWGRDFMAVDEHYGSLEDYQLLSATLHKNGMYLIQDIVPNHTGNFFYYDGPYDPENPRANFTINQGSLPTSAPTQRLFSQNDALLDEDFNLGAFHWTPSISNFQDSSQIKNYQLSDLDDINTSNPQVREELRRSYNFWIREVGVDAFRIDTVKYAEHDYWRDFHFSQDPDNPGVINYAMELGKEDFFTFGEAWYGGRPYEEENDLAMAQYIGTPEEPQMSSILGFGLNEEIRAVFGQGKATDRLTYRIDSTFRNYTDPYRLLNFIDNHDMTRFLASAGYTSLQAALAFMFTMPGIPIIYYGTEQEFDVTRASMFADGFSSGGEDHFNPDSRAYQFIQELVELRKSSPAFSRGGIEVLADVSFGAGYFAYTREWEDEKYLVLFNTSRKNMVLDNLETGLAPGTVLENLLSTVFGIGDQVIDHQGQMSFMLPPFATLIWKVSDTVEELIPPDLVIEVDNLVNGENLTKNFTLKGSAQGTEQLKMYIDGDFNKAINVPVENGIWEVLLPVENLANGEHVIVFQGITEDSRAFLLSQSYLINVDVEYVPLITVQDPVGDDQGPEGRYQYPTHESFLTQMDIESVSLSRAGNNLKISITPVGPVSTVWAPQMGYDHVAYYIYIDVPGVPGATDLPYQNAQVPEGMDWDYLLMQGGWMSFIYSSRNSGPTSYGDPSQPAPLVLVDTDERTIDFIVSGTALGSPESLSGVKVYVTTWDYDGLESSNRLLEAEAGEYIMGGGDFNTDPLIMDDTQIITIP